MCVLVLDRQVKPPSWLAGVCTPRLYFAVEGASGRNRAWAAPVARQTRFSPIDAGSHFMRENTRFRTISIVRTSPWCSKSTAICKHCLANHDNCVDHISNQQHGCSHFSLRSAHPISTLQLHSGGRVRAKPSMSRARRTIEGPPIDAGSHFMRENMGFRAISNVRASPLRSKSSAICKRCLANHITTALATSAINNMDAAIPLLSAHPKSTLLVEDAPERNRAWAAPVAQTRFPTSTPGATIHVRFLTSNHHPDTASPVQSASTGLRTTLQLRQPRLPSQTWTQPLQHSAVCTPEFYCAV